MGAQVGDDFPGHVLDRERVPVVARAPVEPDRLRVLVGEDFDALPVVGLVVALAASGPVQDTLVRVEQVEARGVLRAPGRGNVPAVRVAHARDDTRAMATCEAWCVCRCHQVGCGCHDGPMVYVPRRVRDLDVEPER